jgi:Neutral/alkaline non-lysosomal ceramidase, N-terminal
MELIHLRSFAGTPACAACCILVLCLVMLMGARPARAQTSEEKVFRAGAAMSNITPPLGISLAGSMTDHTAAHIHDELHARCIVLDDGSTRLAIVLIDNCLIPRHIHDGAKKLIEARCGIPASHVLTAATHSHSAPTVTAVFQSDPNEGYIPFLVERIADGVQRAVNQLEPARIAWGNGSLPDQVFNRRWYMNPEGISEDPFGNRNDTVRMNPPRASEHLIRNAGPTDPEISILALESLDGRPIALLANYSLHYVGGVGPGHVSADYFAIFAVRIQELLDADRQDPPFVGIMSNGTSGDINNIDFSKEGTRQKPYEQMTIVAHAAAAEVHRAYAGLEWRDTAKLDAAVKELELGVRKPDEAEIERARGIVDAAKGPAMSGLAEIYARETLMMSEYPDTVPLVVQALRIGDLSIAAIPCEVFAEIGLHLKAESPFDDAFTIQLANGYNGYLPTPAQHKLGGYETWRAKSSYLEETASDAITASVLDLYGELRARKGE